MNKELKKFLETEFKTKAKVIDSKVVEVTAPDGEVVPSVMSSREIYKSRNTQL